MNPANFVSLTHFAQIVRPHDPATMPAPAQTSSESTLSLTRILVTAGVSILLILVILFLIRRYRKQHKH